MEKSNSYEKRFLSGMICYLLTIFFAFISGVCTMWWNTENVDFSVFISIISTRAFLVFFLSCIILNIQFLSIYIKTRISCDDEKSDTFSTTGKTLFLQSCLAVVVVTFILLLLFNNDYYNYHIFLGLIAILSFQTITGSYFYLNLDSVVFNKVRNRLLLPAIYTFVTPLYLGYVAFDIVHKTISSTMGNKLYIIMPYLLIVGVSCAICGMVDKFKNKMDSTGSANPKYCEQEAKMNNTYFWGVLFFIPSIIDYWILEDYFKNFKHICLFLVMALFLSIFDALTLPGSSQSDKAKYTSSISIALLISALFVPLLFAFSNMPFLLMIVFCIVWIFVFYIWIVFSSSPKFGTITFRTMVYFIILLFFVMSLVISKLNQDLYIVFSDPFFEWVDGKLWIIWTTTNAPLLLSVIVYIIKSIFEKKWIPKDSNPLIIVYKKELLGRSRYFNPKDLEGQLIIWFSIASIIMLIMYFILQAPAFSNIYHKNNFICAILIYVVFLLFITAVALFKHIRKVIISR